MAVKLVHDNGDGTALVQAPDGSTYTVPYDPNANNSTPNSSGSSGQNPLLTMAESAGISGATGALAREGIKEIEGSGAAASGGAAGSSAAPVVQSTSESAAPLVNLGAETGAEAGGGAAADTMGATAEGSAGAAAGGASAGTAAQATGIGTDGGIGGTGIGAQGSTGSYLGIANDAYNAFKSATNSNLTADQQAHGTMRNVGLGVADYFTGGLAGLAANALLNTGIGKRFDNFAWNVAKDWEPMTMMLNGLGVFHTSTKAQQKANTAGLVKLAKDDPTWMNYLTGMRGNMTKPAEGSPAYDGKYKTWDEYQKAGLDAKDLSGVYGNMDVYGPDWSKYSQDQREKITQGLIDNNLYYSNKGDIYISDRDKAKQIRDQIIGAPAPIPSVVAMPIQNNAPQQITAQQAAPLLNMRVQ